MKDNRKLGRALPLLVISFSVGFYALISQVSFLREILVVFYGNELCIGLIFSFWLVGIFIGALAASYGRTGESKLAVLANCIFFLLIVLTPLQIGMIRFSRIIFSTPPGEYIEFIKIIAASSLFVSPTSILIGALFPIISKLFSSHIDRNATTVTNVYVWEAIGSLCGGLAFTFLFIPFFDTFMIIFIASPALALSIGLLSTLIMRRGLRRSFQLQSVSLISIIIVLFFIGVPKEIDRKTAMSRWRSFAGSIELVKQEDSKYQNIAIAKQDELYSVYINGQYQNSFPDPYQSTIRAHLIMSQHPEPHSLLIIGGGYTGLLEEILKYPVQRVDYVELDPFLIPLVSMYLTQRVTESLDDPRIHIHNVDGRHFLKFSRNLYDIILVSSQDPSTASANRYYTREFFGEVKEKLTPGGVFVTTLSSSVNYFGEDMLGYVSSVYDSIRSVFKNVIISPTEDAFFFASDSMEACSSDPDKLALRFQSRGIQSELFSKDFFKLVFPAERVDFVKRTLEERSEISLNTDFKPVTYFYSLKLWARYSGSSIQKILTVIEAKGKAIWILLAVIILLVSLIWTFPTGKKGFHSIRPPLILCIASTGFSGMAWSLMLIFSFQNVLGYLYGAMGALIALFMLGLALGSLSMRFLRARMGEVFLITLSDLLVLVFSFLIIPALSVLYSIEGEISLMTEFFFYILMFASGFLTGFEFPVAIRFYLSVSKDIRRSAGIIDGSDHFGAAFGALLTGVLLIPLAGLWLSALAVGIIKIVSFLVLMVGIAVRRS